MRPCYTRDNCHYGDKKFDTFFILMCFSIGTHKIINFLFVPNAKLMVLGVPITPEINIFLFVLNGN